VHAIKDLNEWKPLLRKTWLKRPGKENGQVKRGRGEHRKKQGPNPVKLRKRVDEEPCPRNNRNLSEMIGNDSKKTRN